MARSSDDEFFEVREDWSRRKHLILKHYLTPATAKLRRASPDRRVIILDGFAGRGRYADGTPGSPVQMGQITDSMRAWSDPVDLRIVNIEASPENHVELQASTDAWVRQGVIKNYNTSFREALPLVLTEAAASPLFAFLDPFRPTQLPFNEFKPLLKRTAITEILIVFHTPHVRRIIDQVRSPNTNETTRLGSAKTLNSVFGSECWTKFLSNPPTSDSVVQCFIDELFVQSSMPGKSLFICDTPIEARHGSNLKYHIVFITRHQDGVRLINDAFVEEKQDVFSKIANQTGTLFEEFADPMEAQYRPANVEDTVLDAARRDAGRLWAFKDLLLEAMTLKFGQFSETEFTRATRVLLEKPVTPRLLGISGSKLKNGKWKVDTSLLMRLEV